MIDTTALIESASPLSFDYVSSKYDAILSLYSVRTNNVLQALADKYSDKQTFLEEFVKMSRKEIATLKNCGAKTIEEILAIQSFLDPHHEGQHSDAVEIVQKTLPDNIDTLLPLIMPLLEGLSVRAKNGFAIFLEENNNSLTDLYAAVTNPKFNPVKMKNVGRNTAREISELFDRIKEYLESFADEQAVADAVAKYYTKTYDDLLIPTEAQDCIRDLENSLGYFPLFASINAYLDSLEGEKRAIVDGCILIHEGQPLQNRDEIAAAVGLSPERVRQKRNKLMESLAAYFATYRTFGFVDKCPYNYQMNRVNEEINSTEGTDFSLPFVNWVLASTFEEIAIFGDVMRTLTGYYEKHFFVCLAPADLCQYMDFNAFLEDVEARLTEKRIDEEKVNLRNLIDSHLKTQYCEDEMPAIETACRSILFLHYPVEVDFGQVIFKANARKNNSLVVEEILRAAGHPLTLEEIYDEFIYQYPERYTEMNSLRGTVNNNPNIIPIGRSSTYTLAEWEGDTIRGGTIRQIVSDYLHSLDLTIATLSDITENVRQFRPTTDEYSILTNLSLEQTGMFSFFFRDGVRYIGLSENTYPIEFFPYSGDARNAVTMSINYPKLITFIVENGHFPFSSGVDEEEQQLCSFWRRQEHYYNAGELSASGLEYHTRILAEYGHLQMDKKTFEWRRKYAVLWQNCFGEGSSNLDEESKKELDIFTANMLHDYNYCIEKLPQWKREAIEKFMNRLKETSHVQDNLG